MVQTLVTVFPKDVHGTWLLMILSLVFKSGKFTQPCCPLIPKFIRADWIHNLFTTRCQSELFFFQSRYTLAIDSIHNSPNLQNSLLTALLFLRSATTYQRTEPLRTSRSEVFHQASATGSTCTLSTRREGVTCPRQRLSR